MTAETDYGCANCGTMAALVSVAEQEQRAGGSVGEVVCERCYAANLAHGHEVPRSVKACRCGHPPHASQCPHATGCWCDTFTPTAEANVQHSRDSDCTLDAQDCCTVCSTFHGDACEGCGGRGYHASSCALVECLTAENRERYELARYLGYEKGATREYDDARAAEGLLASFELPTDAPAVRAFWSGQMLHRTGAKWR